MPQMVTQPVKRICAVIAAGRGAHTVAVQAHGGSEGSVRNSRSTAAAVFALVGAVLLGGCGGGSSSNAGTHATPSAPPPPPKVVSVTPHKLKPESPITVTFRTAPPPGTPLPTLHPGVPGSWALTGTTAVFTPSQAYPPDTDLQVDFAKRAGAKVKEVAARTTPHGSLLRVQQILARLHYLPLATTASAPTTPAAEADAVYHPPAGTFRWRYHDVPDTLRHDWVPGGSSQVLRGAVIAFQHHSHLPIDAAIGRHTWQALTAADLAHKVDPRPYAFVSANLYLPQRLSVWVNGHTTLTSAVNGGVAGAPTPLGTYPIYERFTSTTMSGTNPSGSHYSDPGVPWVNYFSGGSAVHGFPRASYGSPQSVGCLELPISTAKEVFGMVDYGTLVNVTGPKSSSGSGDPAPPPPA
jgi:lipoprotein-anchoring transpeptidase ErfK/SrfK